MRYCDRKNYQKMINIRQYSQKPLFDELYFIFNDNSRNIELR